MRKRELFYAVMAVLLSYPCVGHAAEYQLDDIIVYGNREKVLQGGYSRTDTSYGLMGERDIIDTPSSASVIGPRTVEQFTASTLPLDKVLSVNPSVRMAGSTLH